MPEGRETTVECSHMAPCTPDYRCSMHRGRESSPDGSCTSLHPTLMVRCILKDTPHLTGKSGGLVHLFSTAWEDREQTPPARETT